MASPVVAGVAALIRSYFPQLTAAQVKYALENSAAHLGTVNKPLHDDNTTDEPIQMRDLAKGGL